MNLCPQPKQLKLTGGALTNVYSLPTASRYGLHNRLPTSEDHGLEVEYRQDTSIGHEAYRLWVGEDKVIIAASGAPGKFYAEQTLSQLEQIHEMGIPCLEIEDAPDFSVRGYMLDVSRCKIPKIEELYGLIDLLAHFKFNQLQLYFEHVFRYSGHEQVWQHASAFSGEEIKSLDAYCKERFIELVPNQNSLGHMERWLKHPKYHHLAECPQGFVHPLTGEQKLYGSTLSSSQASLNFLDGLYGELLPNFSSKQLNVGCDEPWEFASGRSKSMAEKIGQAGLYHDWLNSLGELSRKHGRHMQFWADGVIKFSELLERIPVNSTPIIWGYEAEHPFAKECQVIEQASLPFLVAPGDSTWNSFSGRYQTAKLNVENAAIAAMQYGAKGILMTHWGDSGHVQTWPVQLPGIVLAAAHAWNVRGDVDVAAVLNAFLFRDANACIGQAIVELGSIDNCLPISLHNRSVLFDMFLANKKINIAGRESIKPKHFEECLALLDSVATGISKSDMSCANAAWINQELELACDMLGWAISNAQADFCGRSDSRLKAQLDEITHRYQEVWMRRNRSGGLIESVGGLY